MNSQIEKYKKTWGESVDQFIWRTKYDDLVCSTCKERENKLFDLIDIEELFPAHEGCRCWLLPVISYMRVIDNTSHRQTKTDQIKASLPINKKPNLKWLTANCLRVLIKKSPEVIYEVLDDAPFIGVLNYSHIKGFDEFSSDLIIWQGEAIRKFFAGLPIDSDFENKHIPDAYAEIIKICLKYAESEDEINTVFDTSIRFLCREKEKSWHQKMRPSSTVPLTWDEYDWIITPKDIERACADWDKTMPALAGLLDAHVEKAPKNEGAALYYWVTADDDQVCEACKDREGIGYTEDEIKTLEIHEGCRCKLIPEWEVEKYRNM